MNCKDVTAIRVAIGGSAELQALIRETPASLTLRTPSASVHIQVVGIQMQGNSALDSVHVTNHHSGSS